MKTPPPELPNSAIIRKKLEAATTEARYLRRLLTLAKQREAAVRLRHEAAEAAK